MKSTLHTVRKAEHAGSWYSKDPEKLNKELSDFLAAAQAYPSNLKAIIAPHAGYSYSGATAAWAYKNIIPSRYNRVFLLGPSHKVHLDFIATTNCNEYATPLGNLPIDHDTIEELLQHEQLFQKIHVKFEQNEHSLEMHCPYIKKVFANQPIKIVPLMVGDIPKDSLPIYGDILAKYFNDPETLFVVSTDFCHWGERFNFQHIFDKSTQIHSSIEKLDRIGMDLIEKHDLKGFKAYFDTYKNTICGRMPLMVLLAIINAPGAIQVETKFVQYNQSTRIQDDMNDSSVSYASGIISDCRK